MNGLQRSMQRLWLGYSVALQRNPLITKCVTGVFGTIISDFVAQVSGHHLARAASAAATASHSQAAYTKEGAKQAQPRFRYEFDRTLRLVVWSIFVGTPIAHYWFQFLDTNVYPSHPTSNAAVVTKLLLDQLVMAPAGTALFFFGYKFLEGGNAADARASLFERWAPTMAANYLLWPAANIINFKFVPPEQRILYVNVIAILWGSFMSHMANSKPAAGQGRQPSGKAGRTASGRLLPGEELAPVGTAS